MLWEEELEAKRIQDDEDRRRKVRVVVVVASAWFWGVAKYTQSIVAHRDNTSLLLRHACTVCATCHRQPLNVKPFPTNDGRKHTHV